jgi:LytS/YehU family sensor histidine kinase
VENSKALSTTAEKSGIGLQNVHRRLELSYPDQYQIKIEDKPDTYFVQLILNLSTESAVTNGAEVALDSRRPISAIPGGA